MGDGMLSLSWNNHRATFCHILSTLREKERYTDVTVACEGKFYPVHKLVLSTCSEYFEKIFENTPCKHPVIVLKDVQTDELEALLSYMYEGAVSVAQNDLARLIKAAEVLRIKGLAVPDEPPIAETSSKRPTQSRNVSDDRSSPHPKRRRREESSASLQGTAQTSATPPTSPRVSPFSNEHETQHTVPRTQSDTRWMDQRSSEREEQSTEHILDDRQADQTSTTRSSPTPPQVEVMVDETLVKEEMVDHVDNNQDDVIDSGMDYGSMGSDSRLDGSGGGEDDPASHMLPNKFEQKVNPSQGQSQLPEAVVEALAGPSGMQGWLSGCEMPAGFSGLEGYSGGDGSQQDVHPPPQGPPGTQPQAHQLMLLNSEQKTRRSDGIMGPLKGVTSTSKLHHCPYCSYRTNKTTNLNNHIRVHTGEKPYSCPHCPYRATQENTLKFHIRTHTGEKPYACNYCPYRSIKIMLKRNEQRTGPSVGPSRLEKVVAAISKTHQCPYCPYTSKKATNLKNHVRVHTGEKPYSCPHCHYRARQNNNMLSHIRTHTGEKPYICDFCPYRAINISTLKRHVQAHHCFGALSL